MNQDIVTQEETLHENENSKGKEAKQEYRPLRKPKARLFQSAEAWILQLALPGVNEEEIKVEERGQELYVYASNETTRFERSFRLPEHERFTEISAELNLGLLSIKVKSAKPEVRQIKVCTA